MMAKIIIFLNEIANILLFEEISVLLQAHY